MKIIKWLFLSLLAVNVGFSQINPENPSESRFPGGYITLGIQFGSPIDTEGGIVTSLQTTVGVVVPWIGKSGLGPYLFPGVTFGRRKTYPAKTISSYVDFQLTYFVGFWGGVGIGRVYSDAHQYIRVKAYGGFLLGGVTYDRPLRPVGQDYPSYLSFNLGLAYPFFGYHFMP